MLAKLENLKVRVTDYVLPNGRQTQQQQREDPPPFSWRVIPVTGDQLSTVI